MVNTDIAACAIAFMLALAAFFSAAAFASSEVVVNGGFETGELGPWVTDDYEVAGGAHSGRFCAVTTSTVYWLYAPIRQDLNNTFYPEEVINAKFWLFNFGSGIMSFEFYLGDNFYDDEITFTGWGLITFPSVRLRFPFNYAKIIILIADYSGSPPYYLEGRLDDVSILITPTAVRPTSLGRVKAIYR